MTHAPSNRALGLAAALALTLAAGAARAEEGTPEQREACAPDAIKLCSDTIPDVPRTTACMKAHEAELTPRCRQVLNEATGPSQEGREETHARRDDPDIGRPRLIAPPDADDDDDDANLRTRRAIARLCDEGAIDPGTCERTERALEDAQ